MGCVDSVGDAGVGNVVVVLVVVVVAGDVVDDKGLDRGSCAKISADGWSGGGAVMKVSVRGGGCGG